MEIKMIGFHVMKLKVVSAVGDSGWNRRQRSAVSQMTYREKQGKISHSFSQAENLEGIE